ncbi:MAG: DUF1828 domain-containing protein [Armatimonadetes bacterium]|nr:DUF1828 domain-containing protein [Armatimonadota bacterium]
MKWLKDKTKLRQAESWVEITTPYLDQHNDYLQLYTRRENGSYIPTDDGYVLDDLAQCGCGMERARRQALLNTTLHVF